MSLVLNHTGYQYQSQKSGPALGFPMVIVYPLNSNAKKKKKKRHHRHFINLSLLSNCVILKLCKPYVNNIASQMGFHKYIFCVFLTQQVFYGWVYKKCQDFKLKKTLKGQLSSNITVFFFFFFLPWGIGAKFFTAGLSWVVLITKRLEPHWFPALLIHWDLPRWQMGWTFEAHYFIRSCCFSLLSFCLSLFMPLLLPHVYCSEQPFCLSSFSPPSTSLPLSYVTCSTTSSHIFIWSYYV